MGTPSRKIPSFCPPVNQQTNRSDNELAKIYYRTIMTARRLDVMYFSAMQGAAFNVTRPTKRRQFGCRLFHIPGPQLGSGSWNLYPDPVGECTVGPARGFYQAFFPRDHNVPALAYEQSRLRGVTKSAFYMGDSDPSGRRLHLHWESWPKILGGADGVYQFVDHAAYLRGTACLQIRPEIWRTNTADHNHLQRPPSAILVRSKLRAPGPRQPHFPPTGILSFLTGNVSVSHSRRERLPRDSTIGDLHLPSDDWHIPSQRLTVNLGVR